MAIATEIVARRYENVSAGVPISVDIPVYEAGDINVYYGLSANKAQYNVDYTLALGDDFNTFTLVPLAVLIGKIEALMTLNPEEENFITVRRSLDFKTDATPPAVRYTPFTSREFERTAMRFQQIDEQLKRTFQLNLSNLGDTTPVGLTVERPIPRRLLRWNDNGNGLANSGMSEDTLRSLTNDAVAQGDVPLYASLVEVLERGVRDGITSFRVAGYYAGDGEGAAWWVYSDIQVAGPGKRQDSNGVWFELAASRWHPKMLGAYGNGEADDYATLRECIIGGKPVYWGNVACVYRTTLPVLEAVNHAIDWTSSGASVVYDGAVAQRAVDIQVRPFVHQVLGSLTFDANWKAFDAIVFRNQPGTLGIFPQGHPDFIAEGLSAKRAYRSSKAFGGGNGIYISGGWNRVYLVRPDVRECRMAVGAHIQGSQGIFGITVADDNNGQPHQVRIVDPYVDGVWCEDPAVTGDQDGIRVFSTYNDYSSPTPSEASFILEGGTVRNCRNRSVKSQMQFGLIVGTKFVRTVEANNGVAGTGTGHEIDLQVGGGGISDIEVDYDGFVPYGIVRMTETISTTERPSPAIVSGIRGVVLNATLRMVEEFYSADNVGRWNGTLSRVNIDGPVQHLVRARLSSSSVRTPKLNLTDCFVDLTVSAIDYVSSGRLKTYMTNVHNTSETEVPVITDNAAGALRPVSAMNCSGFSSAYRISQTEAPPATRVHAVAPMDVTESGMLKPFSVVVPSGETVLLPRHGYGVGNHILIISANATTSNQGQAIFSVSTIEVKPLALVASQSTWGVGGQSEPASGSYRLWASPDGSGTFLKNTGASERTFFGLQIG